MYGIKQNTAENILPSRFLAGASLGVGAVLSWVSQGPEQSWGRWAGVGVEGALSGSEWPCLLVGYSTSKAVPPPVIFARRWEPGSVYGANPPGSRDNVSVFGGQPEFGRSWEEQGAICQGEEARKNGTYSQPPDSSSTCFPRCSE